ncbi:MAG: hypothetical protein RQ729_05420, partial [Wenzhouxiangellaceae bacterium]|nr:hypothetical protein [Wenzhouxiangellaceae bacterium]
MKIDFAAGCAGLMRVTFSAEKVTKKAVSQLASQACATYFCRDKSRQKRPAGDAAARAARFPAFLATSGRFRT